MRCGILRTLGPKATQSSQILSWTNNKLEKHKKSFAPFSWFSITLHCIVHASFFNLVHFIEEMNFSDKQRKFIILQFAKGMSAIAVKRKFLETYAIWGKQRGKFTLTDFQHKWQRFQDWPLGQVTNRGGWPEIRNNNYSRVATHYENNLISSMRASSRALDIPSTSFCGFLGEIENLLHSKTTNCMKYQKDITKYEKHFACGFHLRIKTSHESSLEWQKMVVFGPRVQQPKRSDLGTLQPSWFRRNSISVQKPRDFEETRYQGK